MDKALALGYAGLRVAGNTSWLSADDWQSFRGYEEGLYGAVAHEPMLTVCSYPRYGAWIPDIIEILSSHQRALIKRAQGWELIDCARQRKSVEYISMSREVLGRRFANILVANNACAISVLKPPRFGANTRDVPGSISRQVCSCKSPPRQSLGGNVFGKRRCPKTTAVTCHQAREVRLRQWRKAVPCIAGTSGAQEPTGCARVIRMMGLAANPLQVAAVIRS